MHTYMWGRELRSSSIGTEPGSILTPVQWMALGKQALLVCLLKRLTGIVPLARGLCEKVDFPPTQQTIWSVGFKGRVFTLATGWEYG